MSYKTFLLISISVMLISGCNKKLNIKSNQEKCISVNCTIEKCIALNENLCSSSEDKDVTEKVIKALNDKYSEYKCYSGINNMSNKVFMSCKKIKK